MNRTTTLMVLALGFIAGSAAVAEAQDLNRRPFLAPEIQTKVNTIRAKAMLAGNRENDITRTGTGGGCGDLVLNQTEDDGRPREQIIVADNIINVNSNCKR